MTTQALPAIHGTPRPLVTKSIFKRALSESFVKLIPEDAAVRKNLFAVAHVFAPPAFKSSSPWSLGPNRR